MSRREAIEDALSGWREAERALLDARDGRRSELESEVVKYRTEYQRLSNAGMLENMERLRNADERRAGSTPSTDDFHAAALDTERIAGDIWEDARRMDRDARRARGPSPTEAAPVDVGRSALGPATERDGLPTDVGVGGRSKP